MTTPDHEVGPGYYVNLRDYIDARLIGIEQNTAARLRAQEITTEKIESAITYRLESLNEFRQTLNDQKANYATRNELEAMRQSHDAEIAGLSRQLYIVVGALATLQLVIQFIA